MEKSNLGPRELHDWTSSISWAVRVARTEPIGVFAVLSLRERLTRWAIQRLLGWCERRSDAIYLKHMKVYSAWWRGAAMKWNAEKREHVRKQPTNG